MDDRRPPWPGLPPQPLVTIVTPSLNQGQFIEATIRSVLDQDYPAIEYIVMDGGSTDGTVEVLRRYEDRLEWTSAPDGGQAEAINRGWRRGRGDILAWLNADDIYLSGAVGAAVASLRASSHAAGVYGNCDYIDEHGQLIGAHPTTPFDYTAMLRTARTPIPQPATFLRRVAVEAVGYLDENLTMLLDFDLWLRMGAIAPFVYLPRPLAGFREHSASKTVAHQARAAPETLAIYGRLFGQPDLPPSIKSLEKEATSSALIMAGNSFLMAGRLAEARRHALAGIRCAPKQTRVTALRSCSSAPWARPASPAT
jgi:hypothetical protein